MKKFILAIILSLVVFSSSPFYFKHHQQAEATIPVIDYSVLAKVISQLTEAYKQGKQLAKQIEELENIYNKADDIYKKNVEILQADIYGVLGEYGVGATSPTMNKYLSGVGLKDVLKDEYGNEIGQGGFLGGAFKGVLESEDVLSSLLHEENIKLPPSLLSEFKSRGWIPSEGLLKAISGNGTCAGAGDGGIVYDKGTIEAIERVFASYGADDRNSITTLIDKGCITGFSAQEILKADAPDAPPPHEVAPDPLKPPCVKWLGSGGCAAIKTSLTDLDKKGDFPTNPGDFIARIFTIVLSMAGGIALLLIISAGYKIMASSGKPEAIQAARDQLISSIVGLVFIIFSFVIFQLILVDILHIPGIN